MKLSKPIKIAVASGKGGVGKSMLTAALAMFLNSRKHQIVAVDCDVDAPNLNIWLAQTGIPDEKISLETSSQAFVDEKKCIGCGLCQKKCIFEAVKMVSGKARISPFTCEGCGRCALNCPVQAIKIKPVENGCINITKTAYGFTLVSGELYPGESGSGKIIDAVKEKAQQFPHEFMLIDSSPGTGCPVTAALRDTDFVILITEPSPSGFQDLRRVGEVVKHFRINYGVVVNKWDINKKISRQISAWAGPEKFLGQISYDKKIVSAVANLQPLMTSALPVRAEISNIFDKLQNRLVF
jgi:MinD superfamily P-loop ATPase